MGRCGVAGGGDDAVRVGGGGCLRRGGDSAGQAIVTGEPLAADLERVLGPDHPGTLASRGQPRRRLQVCQFNRVTQLSVVTCGLR
jgi:hypothetical protein